MKEKEAYKLAFNVKKGIKPSEVTEAVSALVAKLELAILKERGNVGKVDTNWTKERVILAATEALNQAKQQKKPLEQLRILEWITKAEQLIIASETGPEKDMKDLMAKLTEF